MREGAHSYYAGAQRQRLFKETLIQTIKVQWTINIFEVRFLSLLASPHPNTAICRLFGRSRSSRCMYPKVESSWIASRSYLSDLTSTEKPNIHPPNF